MYKKYIIRGAIAFFVAGFVFYILQPLCMMIGVWAMIIFSTSSVGIVGGAILGDYARDQMRVVMFASIGFTLGGVIFFLLGGIQNAALHGAIAGAFGGAGLGLGWRNFQTAALAGLTGAIFVPLAFVMNDYAMITLFDTTGGTASGIIPILFMMIAWVTVPYTGFAVLGGVFGAMLAYVDESR